MKIRIVEVSPRDGLQSLETFVPTEVKRDLINSLYGAGFSHVEETSFAHPKFVPQMADAEQVYQKGSVLVMNNRGFTRARKIGVEKINIVFSPCETFNLNNMGKTRNEIVLMYKTFMDRVPKENVRVYLSMAFGSPYSGSFSPTTIRSCIRDAKMFGNTVVFSDTVGVGTRNEVGLFAEMALEEGVIPALHLHHKGEEEERAISLIRAGLFSGIKEFDSSISGLGGCPFVEGSGGNLSTEVLVGHLEAWGFDCGVKIEDLAPAKKIAQSIKNAQNAKMGRMTHP